MGLANWEPEQEMGGGEGRRVFIPLAPSGQGHSSQLEDPGPLKEDFSVKLSPSVAAPGAALSLLVS